jgi:hypothetical protein
MISTRRNTTKSSINNLLSFIEFRFDGSISFHIRMPHQQPSDRLLSDATIVRTYKWRLLAIFGSLKTNCHYPNDDYIDFYLICEPKKIKNGWSIFAQATMTLLHPTNSRKNLTRSNHIRIYTGQR